ncbi:hypothetical protein M432DRAFT_607089 [Thermoascus aurantiacus ATCC 26904]
MRSVELRKFGADWWDGLDPWDRSPLDGLCPNDLDHIRPMLLIHRLICVPQEGGVWVLDTSDGFDKYPEGMAGLHNALTMEERCMALQRLGAVFCEDADNCSAMQDLGRDPRELAEEGMCERLSYLASIDPSYAWIYDLETKGTCKS